MLYLFLIITVLSLFLTFKRKQAWFLTLPIATLFVYFIVQVAMVPMGFIDTLKFIFSLR